MLFTYFFIGSTEYKLCSYAIIHHMQVFYSEHNQSLSLSQVCVLALHLSKELCRADEDGEQWLQVVRKLPVLPSVLSALELSLRSKQNLYFTEAALHLLLTLARTPQVHTHKCYSRHQPVQQLWKPHIDAFPLH